MLLAAVVGLVLGAAGTSFTANNPAAYPPGGSGTEFVIELDCTQATVHGPRW